MGAAMTAAERVTHPWVAEQERRVRFGIDLGPFPSAAATLEWAQLVEELGFDSFWLRDHPSRAPDDPFTYLAAIAVVTKRIRLGTLVACVRFRHPMLLARVAADVDRLSGGRLVLGLGGGWDAREFEQMCLPLPPPAGRIDGVEETIEILNGMWGEAPFTYEGAHFQVKEANVHPGPVQSPRVPILIGGGGEQRTFRLVARRADASNIEGHGATGVWTPEDLAKKYAALRRRCAEVGRPYESVLRTYFRAGVMLAESEEKLQEKMERVLPPGWRAGGSSGTSRLYGTPAVVVETLRAYVEAGARYFIFFVTDEESLRLLAERVVPKVVGE
jgi:alkanesulfonate monooxygenase SsuD/methylene tetrahydromethanopterin reductase-like flavin-dependent oxidoreductase (luciferase family)